MPFAVYRMYTCMYPANLITTVIDDLDGVEAYVKGLIQHLDDELPESLFPRSTWAKTPFMWFATAGMRILPTDVADALTEKIRQVSRFVPQLFVLFLSFFPEKLKKMLNKLNHIFGTCSIVQ